MSNTEISKKNNNTEISISLLYILSLPLSPRNNHSGLIETISWFLAHYFKFQQTKLRILLQPFTSN